MILARHMRPRYGEFSITNHKHFKISDTFLSEISYLKILNSNQEKLTEAQKNRILKKIETLKKTLRREKTMFGGYHDGAGYRYSIADLYFKLQDYKKTNRYLGWFEKTFPGDGKYPYFLLGEAITKFERGKFYEAKLSIININEQNTYLIDLVLENVIHDQNKYEWIQSESLGWVKKNIAEYKKLATKTFLKWLKEFTKSSIYEKRYDEIISIKQRQKAIEEEGSKLGRNTLNEEERKCFEAWRNEVK